MPPYSQSRISDGRMVRTFSSSIPSEELEWHMDRRDRHVRVIEGSGWKLQLEGNLPVRMDIGRTYFIPKESWHRVIKGSGDLMIEIKESKAGEKSSMRATNSRAGHRSVQIVTEGDSESFRIFWGELGMQVAIMEEQGYTADERRQYIAEVCGLMMRRGSSGRAVLSEDFDIASLGKWLSNNKFLQGIQKQLAMMLVNPLAAALGIPQGSFVYKVLVNTLENMDAATVQAVVSGKGCGALTSKFAGALQESLVETVLQQMNVAQSGFGNAIAESLQAMFMEEGPFVKTLASKFCSIDVEGMIPGMGSVDDLASKFAPEEAAAAKEAEAQAVPAAGAAAPAAKA